MSDEKKKPQTAQEKLAILLARAEADEAAERVAKMSDEEIAKELADAGVDMEEEQRRMAELLKKHGIDVDAPKEDKKVVPIASAKKRAPSSWIGLAVAAGLVAVIGWQWAMHRDDVPVANPFDAGVVESGAHADVAAPPPSASAMPPPAAVERHDAGACRPLQWDDGGGSFAAEASFDGVIRRGVGFDANQREERFLTLVLDEPACSIDGEPVRELQIFEDEKLGDAGVDLGRLFGRKVTLEGEPFAQETAHHHRPILLSVSKAAAR